jgi:hypothetical protein
MIKLKRLWIIHFLISILFLQEAVSKEKGDSAYECVKWTWTDYGNVRKVYCLEWKKKDCSDRLYKNLCKLGI